MHYGICESPFCTQNGATKSEKHNFIKNDKPETENIEICCSGCGYEITVPKFAVLFYDSVVPSQYYMVDQFGKVTGSKNRQGAVILIIEKDRSEDKNKFTFSESSNSNLYEPQEVLVELSPDLSNDYESAWMLNGSIWYCSVVIYYEGCEVASFLVN